MKPGTRKRLSGAAKALWEAWHLEADVYLNRARTCRELRKYPADLVEIGSEECHKPSPPCVAALLRGHKSCAGEGFASTAATSSTSARFPRSWSSWPTAGMRTLPPPIRPLYEGLQKALHRAGDERWNQNWSVRSSLPGDADPWIHEIHRQPREAAYGFDWLPPGEPLSEIYFLDISRHEDSWKPLLEEAVSRLQNMTTSNLKPSPFLERVKALVPWKLQRVQIFRAPKQRRLPIEVSQEATQHRGAALLYNDGTIGFEAEKISKIIEAPASKYSKPVRVAIYFYGDAPATSMNDEENDKPEPAKVRHTPPEATTNDEMHPNQPGYRDITFPGVEPPRFMQQVLRRLHCNLGHPPRETLVRQLATAKASELALKGARHLRCEVSPPHQPRVSKAFQARRFNDRLCLDVLYLKDVRGGIHLFLNCVDDATCYQTASRLMSRSEENVISILMSGWLCFFGAPDEMALDAEGAFRGMRFESLHAQLNVDVRCVPPDAHWQLGKAERHGQALRYNASRLINQFAALTIPVVNVCVVMACHAMPRTAYCGAVDQAPINGSSAEIPSFRPPSCLTAEASKASDSGRSDREHPDSGCDQSSRVRGVPGFASSPSPQRASLPWHVLSRSESGLLPKAHCHGRRRRGDCGRLALDRNPSSNIPVKVWIRNARGRLVLSKLGLSSVKRSGGLLTPRTWSLIRSSRFITGRFARSTVQVSRAVRSRRRSRTRRNPSGSTWHSSSLC